MNDPMTILKADHREVKKLLTALADSEPLPSPSKRRSTKRKATAQR